MADMPIIEHHRSHNTMGGKDYYSNCHRKAAIMHGLLIIATSTKYTQATDINAKWVLEQMEIVNVIAECCHKEAM